VTRVLMTADTVGGVWTYALDVARALPRCDFHLATMGALLSPSQVGEVGSLPNVAVHAGAFRLEWMPDPWDHLARAGDWLLRLEHDVRPDVIHMNGFVHAALPFAAPVVTVGHSCVLSWFRAVQGADAPDEWARYAQAVRAGLLASACVVAPTQAMLTALQTHYGPLPPSRVIANARDASLFAPGVKESFIFSAGRVWDEAKNIRALAQAAPGLPWPVFVAGDTAGPNGITTDMPQVCMLGRLTPPDLAGRLARASIYALPARYEPFGLSILEAALSGCALVLGDIPSLREVWGDAATYVSPDDVPALHRALAGLCRDDAARQAMAARASAQAAQYSPARLAASYQALYGDVLTQKAASQAL
jgi:glycogen(starch) synthase